MTNSLKDFSDKTQEIIVQWFNTAKANCSVPVSEIDDYYIDPMLFIIEWNDNGLRQRNINKNNITNAIRRFPGFQSFSDNTMSFGGASIGNSSDSIFCVVDFPPMENQQINEDLIDYLRQTYYQVNQPSLGRVFDIKATAKGKFEIVEHRHVF
ncbi:4029_t:CDS:2 [Entrophospora sp. SA101]|nr:4029_t:CDS:2 [Entrophospora sp. SA101]CAJ0837075.1 935_t:CDS:2 [Entrophospora sp. SA101]